jgi:transposase-like protein
MFLTELREKHLVDNALFLVDSTPWLQAALHHTASITDIKTQSE